jgi:hypothetical protein
METIKKIEKMIDEKFIPYKEPDPKDDKPLAATKLKWAGTRYKDVKKWVNDLEAEIASGDKNAMRASISTIIGLLNTIERGLKL